MEKRLKNYLADMDEFLSTLEHTQFNQTTDVKQDAPSAGTHKVDAQNTNAQKTNAQPKEFLESPTKNHDAILREHLTQIQFFQHERLIHLIVTCLFAVLAFAVFFALFFTMNAGLFVLFAALLVLLIPYIRHYYILENGVQRMYAQYDRLLQLLRG